MRNHTLPLLTCLAIAMTNVPACSTQDPGTPRGGVTGQGGDADDQAEGDEACRGTTTATATNGTSTHVRSDADTARDQSWKLDDADAELSLLAAAVTYQDQVAPIMQTACANCHRSGGQRPDLSSYGAVKSAWSSSWRAIQFGTMPPGRRLAADKTQTLKAWADGGFLNSAPTNPPPTTPPPTTPPTTPQPPAPPALPPMQPPSLPPIIPFPRTATATATATGTAPSHQDVPPAHTNTAVSTSSHSSTWTSRPTSDNKDQTAKPGCPPSSSHGKSWSTSTATATSSATKTSHAKGGSSDGGGAPGTSGAAISYARDVQPVLTHWCTGCHRASGTPPDLSTYAAATAHWPEAAEAIASGQMPPSGTLPASAEKVLKDWVSAGMPK